MLSKEIKFLEDAHQVLNELLFESKLSKPVITIQKSPKFYGHCSCAKVWEDKAGEYYEINLAAEYLNRPLTEVLETLVHEMVHQYCNEEEIQDCSRSGNYHNAKYKAAGEAHGLIVTKTKNGWDGTEASEELKAFIKKRWHREIELHRNTPQKESGGTKKSSTRKYVCPVCGAIVRATKEIKIMCMDCEEIMIED